MLCLHCHKVHVITSQLSHSIKHKECTKDSSEIDHDAGIIEELACRGIGVRHIKKKGMLGKCGKTSITAVKLSKHITNNIELGLKGHPVIQNHTR